MVPRTPTKLGTVTKSYDVIFSFFHFRTVFLSASQDGEENYFTANMSHGQLSCRTTMVIAKVVVSFCGR